VTKVRLYIDHNAVYTMTTLRYV